MTPATAQQLLRQLLADGNAERPLVDIGSSAVSGLRHPNPFDARAARRLAHPVQHTRLLDAAEAVALGSDTVRAGWVFGGTPLDGAGTFTDPVGVRWTWSQGQPIPLGHPLELAGVRGIRRHPRPVWVPADGATPPTVPDTSCGQIVVVEPPCPGILELSMALRNPWQFLHDITDGWRVAGALLDWSLETLIDAYGAVIRQVPVHPDLVVYPDLLGFRAGMYLSVADFQTQLRPRLRILLAQIRELTDAPVLLRCHGAVGAVVADLASLEPGLLHLERNAAGVDVRRVRRTVPEHTALHGVTDLVRLGRALAEGDQATAAAETLLLARAWPAMAAPAGIVDAAVPAEVLSLAARFLRGLTPDLLQRLRDGEDARQVLAGQLAAVATPAAGSGSSPSHAVGATSATGLAEVDVRGSDVRGSTVGGTHR